MNTNTVSSPDTSQAGPGELETVSDVVVDAEETLGDVAELVVDNVEEVKPWVVECAGLVNGRRVAEETNPPKFAKLFAFSQKHLML